MHTFRAQRIAASRADAPHLSQTAQVPPCSSSPAAVPISRRAATYGRQCDCPQAASQQIENCAQVAIPGTSRRQLVSLGGGLSLLALLPALPASAYGDVCIGKATEQEDEECRRNVLAKDQPKQESYGKLADNKYSTVSGVPVAVLDDEYAKNTIALGEKMKQYATMDNKDFKVRVPLIKTLKLEGSEWVSKYARGGSARKESARRMYIAVDSLIGHLASNGYAPMNAPKIKKMLANIEDARTFLSENK